MKRLLMLMGILVAAACGGGGKPGPGGGGGGELTLGDVCDQAGQAVCDKIGDCGGNTNDCENIFRQGCCEEAGNCDRKSRRDQGAVDNCVDDIHGLECTAQDIPQSCTGF